MSTNALLNTSRDLRALLADAAETHGVPGAALGVRQGDQVFTCAVGSTSLRSPAPVTEATLFPTGSVMKVVTTTLALSVVAEGPLSLDVPVVEYAPELRFADEAGQRITLRHLLSHTSGLDGDPLDRALLSGTAGEFVANCRPLPSVAPPGVIHSYCNVAFPVVAYVVERLTNTSYVEALTQRVLVPLGIDVVVDPNKLGDRHVSDGHFVVASPEPVALPHSLSKSALVSAGATPVAPAEGLLSIASIVLGPPTGRGQSERLLPEELLAEAMRPQVVPPTATFESIVGWGLGWVVYDWNGCEVVGHDGDVSGCQAWLRVLPDMDAAISLQSNRNPSRRFGHDVLSAVAEKLFDVSVPSQPEPTDEVMPTNASPYVGTFERADARIEIEASDRGLTMTTQRRGPMTVIQPTAVTSTLRAIGPSTFVAPTPMGGELGPIAFSCPDEDGRFSYVTELWRVASRRKPSVVHGE